jgi:hypothetical protein
MRLLGHGRGLFCNAMAVVSAPCTVINGIDINPGLSHYIDLPSIKTEEPGLFFVVHTGCVQRRS